MINAKINQDIASLIGSASVQLMGRAKQMISEGYDIINLAGGEPDFDTPAPIKDEVMRQLSANFTHYTVGKGIPELRSRISQKLQEENHITYHPEEILVTPGGKFAIYLTIRTLLNRNDEVIILDPSWVSYDPIVRASGGNPVHVALSYDKGYEISLDDLESAYSSQTKLLIINYPNNPTGKILSSQDENVLLEFMKRHPDIFLLSDEIYERIIYSGASQISIARNHEIASRVITINGFSKSLAMTGWRLGYLATNQELLAAIYKLYEHSLTTVSGFIQKAGIVALNCQIEIEDMRRIYEERRDFFIQALNSIPHVHCEFPQGAFYAWAKIQYHDMNSFELCEHLLANGIMAVPGESYGLGGAQCIRMSFASSNEMLQSAVHRIGIALK